MAKEDRKEGRMSESVSVKFQEGYDFSMVLMMTRDGCVRSRVTAWSEGIQISAGTTLLIR